MASTKETKKEFFELIKDGRTIEEQRDLLAMFKKMQDIEDKGYLWMEDEKVNARVLTEEELLGHVSDANFEIDVPSEDINHILMIYRLFKQQSISWSEIFEYENKDRIYRISEAYAKEIKKHLHSGFHEVLIVEAEKFITAFPDWINDNFDWHVTLTTMNPMYARLLTCMYNDNEMVDVRLMGVYEEDVLKGKYHTIICLPEFGMRRQITFKDFGEREDTIRDYALFALENLAKHINSNEGGDLLIGIPGINRYDDYEEKTVLETIAKNYSIKEIIQLPEGTLANTLIKTRLLHITDGQTENIDIKKYGVGHKYSKNDFKDFITEENVTISQQDFLAQPDFNVENILIRHSEEWIKYQNSTHNKVKIEDDFSVFRGKAVNKKDADENGNIAVVNIADIGEYEVDYDNLTRITAEERKVWGYVLKTGDLIMTARGTVVRSVIFKEQDYICIASSNVIVVRAEDKTNNPIILKLFLDSPLGKRILDMQQQGMLLNINPNVLKKIEIPKMDSEEVERCVNQYEEALSRYRNTISKANDDWNKSREMLENMLFE